MKFVKIPVVIEAYQYTGQNLDDIEAFVGLLVRGEGPYEIFIPTLEGNMQVTVGDWVIQGVAGEFYPCKDHIFQRTYKAVDDAT